MAEERRRHLRSNRDALNMKQKTKVNVDRSVKSKSITETHEIITPATVSSRQPYRKSNPHLHVKGQPSNEPRLVQDNIYNCSQHQGEAPTHNRPINVQKQQNNLSPPGAAVRYSKCVQSKRSTQKTLRETSPPCCHKIKQRGLHSIEKRPIGGFQAVSCPKDGGNHTGSEAVINQINPCINITIHPTTSYELDNLFMKPPVLTCPAAEGEEFVQFPEDLNLSFTDGKKCCQTTSNLVSGKSHPWFGTEFFQDLDSLENSYMEPTRTSSYPKVPPSYSHLELASDRVHEVNHFGFCPNIRHPPNVWHTKIQKPDCIVSNQNGEPSPYSDLSLDYPEKQPQIFFSSFDYELVDGPKFSSENEIFRTSTNLPGDFAFGQYSGSQFTELNPFLPSQDDGDVFHERLVDWKEEFGGTSLKKRDAELRRFQNNIETLLETPEKIPPSRYLSFTDRQLLSCCLRAWNRLITEKYECAQKLYECHLLRKGLRALAWAVILQDSRARVLQGKCRRAADEYGSGELEVCLQTEVEKNLLRRCFMRWMRHSRNIQSAQTLHRMTLQRRMFSAWLGHTRQAKERADLVKRWGLLQSGRWALELWRRRLFQTREAQFRHQRKTQAILRVILTGWHRHCQRKKQLSDKLVLWEASCVKRMKRVAMRRWSDQLARRLQAEDYWHRLVLSRCFRFWREKSTDCVLSDKVHDFQMTWNKMKMKVVFGQWKVLSSSRRQCSAILKKRESRMCSRVMGRWRQYTMEVKAEKYLIRRRCCWALTRWTVNFELQVELMKYREIKNLHRMGTYWQIWLLQLQLTVECRLHHRRVLRKRAFATWVSAAHLHGRWREAAARLQFACRHRLLQTCFDRWRTELSLRRQKSDCNHSAAPAMSLHFWRAATRGHQALRLRTQNSVKQACNYWTTAAAVSLRRRCQHVTVGTRKLRKICLSMALDGSQARITGRAFEDQDYEGLTQSAFSRWLLLYRSRRCGEGGEGGNTQEDDKGPLNINPVLSDQENARDLEDNAHLSELLQNFQSRAERICLVRTWTRWKGLHETVSVVQVLNQRRLVEGSWKIWRKRRLQIVTAIQFLDWEKRWLCLKAFTIWRQRMVTRRGTGRMGIEGFPGFGK